MVNRENWTYLLLDCEKSVKLLQDKTEITGTYPEVIYTNAYSDGKFVTISVEPDLNLGLVAKGTEKLKNGEMSYDLIKPNAFASRPSAMLKKIGLLSFSMMGKTFYEHDVITQDENRAKGEAQVTKTTDLLPKNRIILK